MLQNQWKSIKKHKKLNFQNSEWNKTNGKSKKNIQGQWIPMKFIFSKSQMYSVLIYWKNQKNTTGVIDS